jgi:hypothetical protein
MTQTDTSDVELEIRNEGSCDAELMAIEEDVVGTDGSLIQRRTEQLKLRIARAERRVIRKPLPSLARNTPLAAIAYRLTFCMGRSTITISLDRENAGELTIRLS